VLLPLCRSSGILEALYLPFNKQFGYGGQIVYGLHHGLPWSSAARRFIRSPSQRPTAIAPRAGGPPFDPYSPLNAYRPEATGGGTPGYNQMLERY